MNNSKHPKEIRSNCAHCGEEFVLNKGQRNRYISNLARIFFCQDHKSMHKKNFGINSGKSIYYI